MSPQHRITSRFYLKTSLQHYPPIRGFYLGLIKKQTIFCVWFSVNRGESFFIFRDSIVFPHFESVFISLSLDDLSMRGGGGHVLAPAVTFITVTVFSLTKYYQK